MTRVAPLFVLLALALPGIHAATPSGASAGEAELECDSGGFAADASDLDTLPWNEVYVTFNVTRELGYAGPGSWSYQVDWGDGTASGLYDKDRTPAPAEEGARAEEVEALFNPRKQHVISHTYDAPGTYQLVHSASGQLNYISDGSGPWLDCVDSYDQEVILFAPESANATQTPASGTRVTATPTPRSGIAGNNNENTGGPVSAVGSSDDGGGPSLAMFSAFAVLAVGAAVTGGVLVRRKRVAAGWPSSGSTPGGGGSPQPSLAASIRPRPDRGLQHVEASDAAVTAIVRASLGDATMLEMLDLQEEEPS